MNWCTIIWVTPEELEKTANTVINKNKTVCLVRDGLSVMDDVGGLSGFANFLRGNYEGEDKQEAANYRRWDRLGRKSSQGKYCKKEDK